MLSQMRSRTAAVVGPVPVLRTVKSRPTASPKVAVDALTRASPTRRSGARTVIGRAVEALLVSKVCS